MHLNSLFTLIDNCTGVKLKAFTCLEFIAEFISAHSSEAADFSSACEACGHQRHRSAVTDAGAYVQTRSWSCQSSRRPRRERAESRFTGHSPTISEERWRLLPSNPSAWTGQLSMKTQTQPESLSDLLTDECLAPGHSDTSQKATVWRASEIKRAFLSRNEPLFTCTPMQSFY